MPKKTNVLTVLELLADHDFSGKELADKLKGSYGSVRTILSFLIQLGFVKSVPEERRGQPYRLTEPGRELLKRLTKNA